MKETFKCGNIKAMNKAKSLGGNSVTYQTQCGIQQSDCPEQKG